MDPYDDVTPFPALPPHLNPHCNATSQPSLTRRLSFQHNPSPLRNSHVPDPNEIDAHSTKMTESVWSPDAYSVSRMCSLPLEPPGLGPPIPDTIPDKVRQAIQYALNSSEFTFTCANKGKLTAYIKDLALRNSATCLDFIQAYAQHMIQESKQGRVSTEFAVSQWRDIQLQLRFLLGLRKRIKEIPASAAVF